jgi:predicted DNA-binding transcriptional regulator YafY
MTYAKPGEDAAERRVHPFGLVSKGGTWYLLAGAEAGLRTFRVSRVRSVSVTENAVERPEEFDLAQAWEGVQEGFPHRQGPVHTITVELVVEPAAVPMLTAILGRWAHLESVGVDTDGERFTAAFPNPSAAAAELARFGGQVKVLSPVDVRTELARIGSELAGAYL